MDELDNGDLRIVLLCPEQQDEALLELQRELHRVEVDFDLVRGVDLDSEHAMRAVHLHLDDALYVICRGGDLDAYCADHLRTTLLRANLIPARLLVVLKLRPGKARSNARSLAKLARSSLRPVSSPDAHQPSARSPEPCARRAAKPDSSASPVPSPIQDSESLDFEIIVDTTRGPRRWGRALGLAVVGTGIMALAALAALSYGPAQVRTYSPFEIPQIQEKQSLAVPEAPVAKAAPSVEDSRVDATPQVDEDALDLAGPSTAAQANIEEVSDGARKIEVRPDMSEVQDQALATAKVREIAGFLVSPQRSDRGTLDAARSFCAQLDVEGLMGWSLPAIAELTTLISAKLTRRGHYWTSTPGNAEGSRQLVYDAHNSRIKNLNVRWRGARAVCVRKAETRENR